jgi:hypothetical protein
MRVKAVSTVQGNKSSPTLITAKQSAIGATKITSTSTNKYKGFASLSEVSLLTFPYIITVANPSSSKRISICEEVLCSAYRKKPGLVFF